MVVVGAGPAGAWAAALMARGGLRVMLVERRPEGQAGARWVNGVAAWLFDAAEVPRPVAPELIGSGHRFTILSPSGEHRVHVDDNPILEVDMRLLGQRLVDAACEAGVEVLWGAEARKSVLGSAGRLESLEVRQGQASWILKARLFVDASGLSAVLRRQVPALAGSCPEPSKADLCVAAQEVREVADPAGAAAWLAAQGGQRGETLAWTGRHGGYSILNVRLDHGLESVSILTGSRALSTWPSGRRILDDFVAEQPWVGPVVFGGSRAIPLRRPYTRLVAPGAALLGDAACQVFSAHGSGIGVGLNAARLLADAVLRASRRGEDPGSLASLWVYAQAFHRRWGGLLAGSDAFRRMSQHLAPPMLEALIGSGLMTSGMVQDTLGQRQASLRIEELPRLLLGASRSPGSLLRLWPVLSRLPMINAVASTYPRLDSHVDVDLFRFEQRMRWLVEGVER